MHRPHQARPQHHPRRGRKDGTSCLLLQERLFVDHPNATSSMTHGKCRWYIYWSMVRFRYSCLTNNSFGGGCGRRRGESGGRGGGWVHRIVWSKVQRGRGIKICGWIPKRICCVEVRESRPITLSTRRALNW